MTNQATWTAVDHYLTGALVEDDSALEAALRDSDAAGLPAIAVAPNQGKLLFLLAKMQNARNILEVGTLGGYSTIWMAKALPAAGRIITLEYEAKHVEVARANIARAGFSEQIDVRHGRAIDTLPKLAAEGAGPFDMVFIDADKPSNADYFTWALKLSRPGTLIVVDNVVRGGKVVQTNGEDAAAEGVRRLMTVLAAEPRVTSTAIQTVGTKGYDGLALILVNR